MQSFTNQATLTYGGKAINSNIVSGNINDILAVSKTAIGESYNTGDSKTFIISLINSGSSELKDLTISDDLGRYEFTPQSGTEQINLYPLSYTEGSVRYFQNGSLQNAPTIDTSEGLKITGISVPAGGSAIIAYQTEITDAAPLDTGSTITNTATITGGNLINSVSASEEITVLSEPELTIIKSLSPKTVTENGNLTYTFDIQNTGNAIADAGDDVTITDTFSPVLTGISVLYNNTALDESQYNYNEDTGVFSTVPGVITIDAATFTQDPETGKIAITPGTSTIEITGTI